MRIPAIASTRNIDNRFSPFAIGQVFKVGAAVVHDGSMNLVECGADPALIAGFSLERCGANPEDATKVLWMPAFEGQKFWMAASATLVDATHRGNVYGLAKDADGIWHVDLSDTTNTRVYVHKVDVDRQLCEVSVREANRQIAP